MHLNLKENNKQMYKIITCITSTDMAAEIEISVINRFLSTSSSEWLTQVKGRKQFSKPQFSVYCCTVGPLINSQFSFSLCFFVLAGFT